MSVITVKPHEHEWGDPLETPFGTLLQCLKDFCNMCIFEDEL